MGLNIQPAPTASKVAALRPSPDSRNPQHELFTALSERLNDGEIKAEVAGLAPGRKFRADILLPDSRIIIEMDGFQFHRSKSAFASDRARQNLLVSQGFFVLRYTAGDVFQRMDFVVQQVLDLHRSRKCA